VPEEAGMIASWDKSSSALATKSLFRKPSQQTPPAALHQRSPTPLSRNHLRSSRTASPSLRRHVRNAQTPLPRQSCQPADALSSTQNDAQPETPPPTPPPTPDPPAKIPDLSRFYPNDPTLDPRFNAYHRFPSFPPSARTSLPRQAQDIPACTADFVAARPRIGHTRHDSRGPSHAN
jgi:hypothetical protein